MPSGSGCCGMFTDGVAGAYVQLLMTACSAVGRLQAAQQRIGDAGAGPGEPRGGKRRAAQRERVAQLTDGRSGCRIVRPVAIRPARLAPPRVLDVDLVGSVCADAGGGPVGKQPQHDVLVVGVDRSVDLPLVGAESQPVGREELGRRPGAPAVRDPQMQVPAGVDGDVPGVALADPRHPARRHLPRVALPGDRRRARQPAALKARQPAAIPTAIRYRRQLTGIPSLYLQSPPLDRSAAPYLPLPRGGVDEHVHDDVSTCTVSFPGAHSSIGRAADS